MFLLNYAFCCILRFRPRTFFRRAHHELYLVVFYKTPINKLYKRGFNHSHYTYITAINTDFYQTNIAKYFIDKANHVSLHTSVTKYVIFV